MTGGAKGIDPCAHLLPKVTVPGESVDQNMKEAQNQVASLRMQTALASPDGTPMADLPGGAIDAWFFSMVAAHQPWDYKDRDPEGAAKGNSIYEDFGNFNYGATGGAAGYSLNVLQHMAGFVENYKNQGMKSRNMVEARAGIGGQYPYGDKFEDAKQIENGFAYFNCRKANSK